MFKPLFLRRLAPLARNFTFSSQFAQDRKRKDQYLDALICAYGEWFNQHKDPYGKKLSQEEEKEFRWELDLQGKWNKVAFIGPSYKAFLIKNDSWKEKRFHLPGSAIGILSKDGVVLIGEKKVTSKLLQTSTSAEKIYKIDDHVACAVAGIMSEANILINTARVQAQRYTSIYQEPMPVMELVLSLSDTKQGYTQFSGLRPFGVSSLFAGWDKDNGFQLYMNDPSGYYDVWEVAAIGANNQAAQSILEEEYKDDATREEAVQLALKVLTKTMDSTSLTSEKLELAEVYLTPSGNVKYYLHSPESLTKLLVKHGVTQPSTRRRMTSGSDNVFTKLLVKQTETSGSGWSDRLPEEPIPLHGCDYKHWLIIMDFNDPKPTKEVMIDVYVKTLSSVVGSEKEAKKKIYSVCTSTYTGFGALISKKLSCKVKGLPGVLYVLPDSYLDTLAEDYGGELFIDGKVKPRP